MEILNLEQHTPQVKQSKILSWMRNKPRQVQSEHKLRGLFTGFSTCLN